MRGVPIRRPDNRPRTRFAPVRTERTQLFPRPSPHPYDMRLYTIGRERERESVLWWLPHTCHEPKNEVGGAKCSGELYKERRFCRHNHHSLSLCSRVNTHTLSTLYFQNGVFQRCQTRSPQDPQDHQEGQLCRDLSFAPQEAALPTAESRADDVAGQPAGQLGTPELPLRLRRLLPIRSRRERPERSAGSQTASADRDWIRQPSPNCSRQPPHPGPLDHHADPTRRHFLDDHHSRRRHLLERLCRQPTATKSRKTDTSPLLKTSPIVCRCCDICPFAAILWFFFRNLWYVQCLPLSTICRDRLFQ